MHPAGFKAKSASVAALIVVAIAIGSLILGRSASPNLAASTTAQVSVVTARKTSSRSDVPVTAARSVISAPVHHSPVSGGLKSILIRDRPPEARTTLALIASNGPLPCSRR